jgi:hypothetical protein
MQHTTKLFCTTLALAACTCVLHAQVRPERTAIHKLRLAATPQRVNLETLDSETAKVVGPLLAAAGADEADPDGVMMRSPGGPVAVAVPVRRGSGWVQDDGSGPTASFAIRRSDGLAIDVSATVDSTSHGIKTIVARDLRSQEGLELNYETGWVNRLSSHASSSPAEGMAACILTGLESLGTPCQAAILGAQFAECIVGITALAPSAGLSAILALSGCQSAISTVLQALACQDVDCGIQEAMKQLAALVVSWTNAPPASVSAGQQLQLGWAVSTVDPFTLNLASATLIVGTSTQPQNGNPLLSQTFSGGPVSASTAANFAESPTLPTNLPAGSIYFVLVADDSSGNHYYSPVVSSMVSAPASQPLAIVSVQAYQANASGEIFPGPGSQIFGLTTSGPALVASSLVVTLVKPDGSKATIPTSSLQVLGPSTVNVTIDFQGVTGTYGLQLQQGGLASYIWRLTVGAPSNTQPACGSLTDGGGTLQASATIDASTGTVVVNGYDSERPTKVGFVLAVQGKIFPPQFFPLTAVLGPQKPGTVIPATLTSSEDNGHQLCVALNLNF